jgi:hypothetical protein
VREFGVGGRADGGVSGCGSRGAAALSSLLTFTFPLHLSTSTRQNLLTFPLLTFHLFPSPKLGTLPIGFFRIGFSFCFFWGEQGMGKREERTRIFGG